MPRLVVGADGAQLHVELLEECQGRTARPRGSFYLRFSLNGKRLSCGLLDPSAPAPLVALEAAADAVAAWDVK